jgi:hypothetical protein
MRRPVRGYAVVALLASLGGSGVPCVLGAAAPQSSETCGSCHRDIYRMWRESAHAESLEDPFFLLPLRAIREQYGESHTRECVRCHAPMATLLDDFDFTRAITREGVNCEFCHSLVDVSVGERGPRHRVEIGEVKRGTIPGADSRGHEVAYSELHADSLICAPCHEYVTADGTQIMSTYSEWKASSSADDGKTCQSCHMTLVESNVVDPRIKRESGARVNLHQMPGGHSIHQLNKALRVRFDAERIEEGLQVTARIRNVGAGHAVPTGMPGRRMVLALAVKTSEGKGYRQERVYEKSYLNGEDRPVELVADLFFAKGLHLREDTRIQPDETREEQFVFPVPQDATAWIDLTLRYEHSPWGEDQERVSFTIFSESRLVRRPA